VKVSEKKTLLRKGSFFPKTDLRMQNCHPLLSQFEKVCEKLLSKSPSFKSFFAKPDALMHEKHLVKALNPNKPNELSFNRSNS
jgi:hypothetical protein